MATSGNSAAGLFEGRFAAVYSYYMEHRWLSRAIASTIWRSDIEPFYERLRELRAEPDGSEIVDAPCGSGIALPHLARGVRYRGLDASEAMLERARRKSIELGRDDVELLRGDATSLPYDGGVADLFLSWWGLHCFERPREGIAEAARCLRPGGRLVGGSFVIGERPLDRLLVRPHRGAFGEVPSAEELRAWLDAEPFADVNVDVRGVFAYFRARRVATA